MISLVFDTETTGLPAKTQDIRQQPKVIELAAIAVDLDTGEEHGRFDSLFDPKQRLEKIITDITGLTDKDVSGQPLFGERQQAFLGLMSRCEAMIAHNLTFDHKMLQFEFRRLDMEQRYLDTIPTKRICTVEQTTFMKRRRMKLSELHEHLFGEAFEGAHRAMVDVEALVRICVELRKRKVI